MMIVILVPALLLVFACVLGGPHSTASALDTNTRVETRPGTILYDDWGPEMVWESDKRSGHQNLSAVTQLISADVDMDGEEELLFGTYNDSLVVLDVPSGEELLNINLGTSQHGGGCIVVGNLDQDAGREIVFSNSQGLYCIDFTTRTVQWSSPLVPLWDHRSEGPLTLVDPDGDGLDHILLRTLSYYYRLDGEGNVVDNVSLEVFNTTPPWGSYLGWGTRMLVADLDGDGDEEVLLSDQGWSAIPEVFNVGRHMWIIDLRTGVLEYSNVWNDTVFSSDPMVFEHEGTMFVAIGVAYPDGAELMLMNMSDRTWEYVDVAGGELTVDWLSLIPGKDDTVLLMVGYQEAIAWSLGQRRVLWTRSWGGSARVESPSVVCDVDNDGSWEVLLPLATVHVTDAGTGTEEADLVISGPHFTGERTAVGDFDGDGYTEIVQGLDFSSDDVFRIMYIDTDAVNYDVEMPNTDPPVTLYAGIENRLGFLTVNMTDDRLPENMHVSMSNEEWGCYLSLVLNPVSGTHVIKLEGPLSVKGYHLESNQRGVVVELTLVPHWDFSFEGTNDLMVNFTSVFGLACNRTLAGAFVVERDLELTGDIVTIGPGGPQEAMDWVGPGVYLQVSGMDVVYEGTDDLHPPRDAFSLLATCGAAGSNVSFAEGEPLLLTLASPGVDGAFDITVRVYQGPAVKMGLGEYLLTLRVDATPPYFFRQFPENSSWFCTERVPFAIEVADDGSGVDTGSVEFCVVGDPGDGDGVWHRLDPGNVTVTGDGCRAWAEWMFEEGTSYILWRFTDRVGHGGTHIQAINVDLQGIYFQDFFPTGWVAMRDQAFEVGVHVADRGGSGVNASSLDWSYSTSDLLSFTAWEPVARVEGMEEMLAIAFYYGEEGKRNLLRFRGRDVAGNEAVTSPLYEVWIDTVPPDVAIVEPSPEVRQPPGFHRVRVNVTDATSGVETLWLVEVRDLATNASLEADVLLVTRSTHWAVYDVSWDAGTGYHLELVFHCRDNAQIGIAREVEFRLNRPPAIEGLSPEEGSAYLEGEEVDFSVTYGDPDGDEVYVEWWLGDMLLSGEADFSNSSLPVGNHSLRVVLRDGYYEIQGHVNLTVSRKPAEPVEPPAEPPEVTVESFDHEWWLVVLVIGIVVAISAVALVRMRASDK